MFVKLKAFFNKSYWEEDSLRLESLFLRSRLNIDSIEGNKFLRNWSKKG